MGRITPSTPSAGSVVGAPSAESAHVSGIGSPRVFAREILPRATAAFAESTATTGPSGPGPRFDHGCVPIRFSGPPHGAIAGLAFVVRTATQPSRAARRVKYMAVPKWLESRTPTTPTPWTRARSTASARARSVSTWPMPCRPSSATRGPVSLSTTGSVRAVMAPLRSRATYQGRRSRPCDWCPQRSAWTRLSATSRASGSGTPELMSTWLPKRRRASGAIRSPATGAPFLGGVVYMLAYTTESAESVDVQHAGAGPGTARAAGGVPDRDRRQRVRLGPGRAGVPALRRLLGRGGRGPVPLLRALRRRRRLRGAQGDAALRAVAGLRRAH